MKAFINRIDISVMLILSKTYNARTIVFVVVSGQDLRPHNKPIILATKLNDFFKILQLDFNMITKMLHNCDPFIKKVIYTAICILVCDLTSSNIS